MKSNLPQKYNYGFFSKIKNFFKRLFIQNKENLENEKDPINENIKINTQEKAKSSIDIIKEENQKNKQKEEVLLQIENNPELINNWSTERILKLEKVFDEKIEEFDQEIAKLKGKIA